MNPSPFQAAVFVALLILLAIGVTHLNASISA